MKRFECTFSAILEVDESVLAEGLSAEFKEYICDLIDEEGVAKHLAYNLARGADLDDLDGWTNMSNSKARITGFECEEARKVR